jgi:hypothetical protein
VAELVGELELESGRPHFPASSILKPTAHS